MTTETEELNYPITLTAYEDSELFKILREEFGFSSTIAGLKEITLIINKVNVTW